MFKLESNQQKYSVAFFFYIFRLMYKTKQKNVTKKYLKQDQVIRIFNDMLQCLHCCSHKLSNHFELPLKCQKEANFFFLKKNRRKKTKNLILIVRFHSRMKLAVWSLFEKSRCCLRLVFCSTT